MTQFLRKYDRTKTFLLLLFLVAIVPTYGQSNCKVFGIITDSLENPVPYATISLNKLVVQSDAKGRFKADLAADNYHIIVNVDGYRPYSEYLLVNGSHELIIRLITTHKVLSEVMVSGDSKKEALQKTAYKPTVVDIKGLQSKPTPVLDILAQVPGVKVRHGGGLGSGINMMIGGASGKAITTFLDDIPLNLLGNGFALNNISGALIEQIEIYKGTVPVHLGADALGGAINIKSRSDIKNYIDASYTYGSFNTHQAASSFKTSWGKRVNQFLTGGFFFNHSDNNYKMYNVDIVVDSLYNTRKGTARRFHDKYTSYTGRLQYGFTDLSWADEIKISAAVSKVDKQWQHGLTAFAPWGKVTSRNHEFNSTISWKKSKADQWHASFIAGYNSFDISFVDTSSYSFYWDGVKTRNSTRGESGFYSNGRTPHITTSNVFGRIYLEYFLNNRHKLAFTSLNIYEQVQGEDTAGIVSFKSNLYATPQKLTKIFNGISLESKFLNNRLINIASLKHYYAQSDVAILKTDNSVGDYINRKQSIPGWGNVVKYRIIPHLAAYAGYEYAVRLPDKDELFGDGLNIAPNGNLVAENSHNINIGFQWENDRKLFATLSGYYRKTENQIFLSPVTRNMSTYLNLLGTKTFGVEASVSVKPVEPLLIYANATYQNPILSKADIYGKVEPRYEGTRIPNIPFFFVNAGGGYTFKNIFLTSAQLHLEYYGSYVREFFLSWESDGISSTKARVPEQLIHNAVITWSTIGNRYNIGLECRNLSNQLAFDNYSVQKAGRSFYIKLRYFLQ